MHGTAAAGASSLQSPIYQHDVRHAHLQVWESGDISWCALAGNAQQLSMHKLLALQG